jgi:hypothetical protein
MNPRRILGIAGSFYLAAEGLLHAIHRKFIVDSSLCALIDDARGGHISKRATESRIQRRDA